MPNAHYLIGRQPILDAGEQIVAYELLFRTTGNTTAVGAHDASRATATVISDVMSGFGLDRILGSRLGFINLGPELLMSDLMELLPRERVVLELLENLQVTPEVIARCSALKEAGFTLALDDHVYDPAFEGLYPLIDIIKVDLKLVTLAVLPPMLELFRRHPVRLLAEKVETRDEYLHCCDLGFELFQGFYFSHPALVEKRRFDSSGATLLKIMRLLAAEAETSEIEEAFRSSPGLVYKLLLLVNSVSIGVRERVVTVRHAMAILGRQQLKRWIQLALFASDDLRGESNPLVDMAAVRAAFMEHLAERMPAFSRIEDAGEQAFMVGILSLLEAIFSITMAEVTASLHLPANIRVALTERSGDFGRLLQLAEELEQKHFSGIDAERLTELGITADDIRDAQLSAYNWRGGLLSA